MTRIWLPLRRLGLALALGGAALAPAGAQDYPTRPVRIVVPFGAGGPADIYARYVGDKLQKAWGQSFVVEARPGAGSLMGTSEVAKAAPDGYTLLMMSNTHTVNETLRPKRSFVLMRDFVPISPVNYSDLIMVVHPSVPAKDLKEFIALAKAKPGQLNYASSGFGTPYHMAGELFKALSGTDIVHVPHKASGDARTAVLGGHVQMMIDAITTSGPTVKAGRLRALGTTGKARSALMPEVPTIAEAGVPDYETTIWLGLMAPKDTPKAVIDKLNAGVKAVLESPETKAAWAKQGAFPLIMSSAEFDAYLRKDIDKWADVIKKAGIKPVQ